MLMAYLTLASGLLISAVAIFYSVAGLTSIFSAAVWPIIIMGTSLEVAKLVATVWLKQNWDLAPRFLKSYLLGAVVVLMFITSMGIFGFLSKAHSDQTLVSGDVGAKIAVYDEKIKIAKDNIDANRKALKQLDEAVDQVMVRSNDEKGADKAVAIRRSQQKERTRLQAEIQTEQKTISQLNEERAPIAAEVRKVESEVGPIKYIAAFVYGETNEGILEKAVTWVIILIVVVFDPLAVMLLLASQYTFALRKPKEEEPLTNEEIEELAIDEPGTKSYVDEQYPIPSFLLKKDEIDLDSVNQQLADAVEYPEPEIPEEELEVHPDEGTAEPVIEYKILEDVDDEEFVILPEEPTTKYQILPQLQEELDKPEPEVKVMGDGEYVKVDGITYHWKAAPHKVSPPTQTIAPTMDERPGDYVDTPIYVQNEEQTDSNKWLGIHTTTEEKYLDIVEEKRKKDGE